jgi:hypothetical protein
LANLRTFVVFQASETTGGRPAFLQGFILRGFQLPFELHTSFNQQSVIGLILLLAVSFAPSTESVFAIDPENASSPCAGDDLGKSDEPMDRQTFGQRPAIANDLSSEPSNITIRTFPENPARVDEKQVEPAEIQPALAKVKRYFLIGNSLTWDTVPELLEGDVQFHIDCGKSLPFIYNHPQAPCVESSTLWPKALREKQYDYVSVQPHYGSTLAEDADVISEWVKMQDKAIFVIHTGWAPHASQINEFSRADTSGPMVHSQSYISALIVELESRFPKRTFRHTQATVALAHIADDIASGVAPMAKLEDLYRDEIHMTLNHGRYLMHNLMRDALEQPRSISGFTDPSSPAGNLDSDWISFLNMIIEAHHYPGLSDSTTTN